jgi:hypothetical protein
MLLALMFAVFFVQIPDAPTAKPSSAPPPGGSMELQGDRLGESVETFMAKHPKAECDTTTQKSFITCYQWSDVAIFGVAASPGTSCSLKKRYAADCLQGLTARFSEHSLTSIVYAVAGTDKTAITAELKKIFGASTRNATEVTTWNLNDAIVSVVADKASSGSLTSAALITVSLTALN